MAWSLQEERYKQTATYIKYDKLKDMHRDFGGLSEYSASLLGQECAGIVRQVFWRRWRLVQHSMLRAVRMKEEGKAFHAKQGGVELCGMFRENHRYFGTAEAWRGSWRLSSHEKRDTGGDEDWGKPYMQGIVTVFLFLTVFQHSYC